MLMVDRTGILAKSPLVISLVSIRYAPWPFIEKKIAEIHEDLRDVLPLLQHIQVQAMGPTGQPQQEPGSIWMLMSGDRTRGVQISQDQILLISRRYTRFAEFSSLVKRVLQAVFVRMRFMDVTNLGVRYVDHVIPRSGESLEQYLHSGLLQPKFEGLTSTGGIFAGGYSAAGKELRIRSVAHPGVMSLPDELVPVLAMMQPPGRALEIQTLKFNEAYLDMDALEQYQEPVRMEAKDIILDKLSNLHEVANAFFRRSDVCTDYAFQVWKGEV